MPTDPPESPATSQGHGTTPRGAGRQGSDDGATDGVFSHRPAGVTDPPMSYEERLLQITHGVDGAPLGTELCGAIDEQCPARKYRDIDGGHLCCALVRGHSGGHRDSYTIPQSAQHRWVIPDAD